MTELGSIFNPGEAEMAKELNSEKVLPAPTPAPGDRPLETEDGQHVYIPPAGDAILPKVPRLKHPAED
ncbi:hypothetical protein [Demequina sp. NBRC 110056]|uniref:hypothetical protein n=1 Tax=Demequina sp. NBRC 110056 TaxID=1570345 RepID=UPI000A00D85D|nr:hypothetical protein [Demequina sp. NBRC 110056]